MKNNVDKIRKVTQKIAELNQQEKMESLLLKNVYEFDLDDEKYRVRRPDFGERELISKERNKKYIEMLSSDDYILEEQLIETYKKKGVSIEKLDKEILALQKTEDGLLIKLDKTQDPNDIKKLEDEIGKLRLSQAEVMDKKNELLKYSLERRLNEHINSYSVYLLLETFKDEKWNKLADSFEAFSTLDYEELFIEGAYYLTMLLWRKN